MTNERLVTELRSQLGDTPMQAPTTLLPSERTQAARSRAIRDAGLSPAVVRARVVDTARTTGFRSDAFEPFEARLPRLLDSEQRLTYAGYAAHGFQDLIGRLVSADPAAGWTLATYRYPRSAGEVATLRSIVQQDPSQVLTGLPAVNAELAQRFLPQFLRGLLVGTVAVILMVALAFRSWKLSTLALLPTAIGLVWTAGLLGARACRARSLCRVHRRHLRRDRRRLRHSPRPSLS